MAEPQKGDSSRSYVPGLAPIYHQPYSPIQSTAISHIFPPLHGNPPYAGPSNSQQQYSPGTQVPIFQHSSASKSPYVPPTTSSWSRVSTYSQPLQLSDSQSRTIQPRPVGSGGDMRSDENGRWPQQHVQQQQSSSSNPLLNTAHVNAPNQVPMQGPESTPRSISHDKPTPQSRFFLDGGNDQERFGAIRTPARPNETSSWQRVDSSTARLQASMVTMQAAIANINSEAPYPSIETDDESAESDADSHEVASDSSSSRSSSRESEAGDEQDISDEQSETDEEGIDSQDEDVPEEDSSIKDRADLAAANGISNLDHVYQMPAPKRKRKTGYRGKGGWNKGQNIGRRGEEPDEDFIAIQNEAMKVFIEEQDNEKALRLIQQAISRNPEVYSAHALLSEIFFAMDEDQKGADALFRGAYATTDRDVWHGVADTLLRLTTIDRRSALKQAVQCYSRLINLNQGDLEAHFQRGVAHRELGAHGRAMKEFGLVLKKLDWNTSAIRQVAGLHAETGHVEHAIKVCEECVKHYQKEEREGRSNEYSWPDVLLYADLFAHANKYREAISKLKQLSRWLLGREEETYWDAVMEDDREWDASDEPRRVEVDGYHPDVFAIESYGEGLPLAVRAKLGVYRIQQGIDTRDEALGHFQWLDPDDFEDGAAIFEQTDIFREVADFLKSAKEHSEALRYYEALRDIGAFSAESNFWLNFAATSYVCGKKSQAMEGYEIAKAVDSECMEARIQLGKLYTDLRDRTKALQHAHEALEIARRRMPETDRRRYEKKGNKEARKAAERVLKQARKLPVPKLARRPLDPNNMQAEWQKQMQQQLKQADQANRKNRRRYTAKASITKQIAKETTEQYRTERVQQLYYSIEDITPGMRSGNPKARRTWIDCATELIADFCSCSPLFPPERHMIFTGYDQKSRADNRQKMWKKQSVASPNHTSEREEGIMEETNDDPSIPNHYRGILFSSWLDLFLETALLHATSDPPNKDASYAVLNAALGCVVWFHEPDSKLQVYTCYFACALTLHDDHILINKVGRWFIMEYRFCTDTYRLFAALNLLFTYPDGGKQAPNGKPEFRDGPTQKFIFRQVRALDSQLPDDYNIDGPEGPVPAFMRNFHVSGMEEEDAMSEAGSQGLQTGEGIIKPQEMDVVLLCVYGHMLYAGGSFPNALSYFYRALTLDPKNPMVLLSISLSYIHQLLKRQVEDRHMHLLNGLAVFEDYADARMEQAGWVGAPEEEAVRQEIAFNRARIWQMMGLTDLAVRGYDEILQSVETMNETARVDTTNEKEDNWSKEAAFSIANIFASNGDPETARGITEKWLIVE